jgi:hypothetical protein
MIAPNAVSQIGNATGPILFQIKETPAGPAQDEIMETIKPQSRAGSRGRREAWPKEES